MQVVMAIRAEAFSSCTRHADGATDGPALSARRRELEAALRAFGHDVALALKPRLSRFYGFGGDHMRR